MPDVDQNEIHNDLSMLKIEDNEKEQVPEEEENQGFFARLFGSKTKKKTQI